MISDDLIVKIALGAVVIGGVVWLGKSAITSTTGAIDAAKQAASDALDTTVTAAKQAATAVNPFDSQNLAYQAANAATQAATGDKNQTFGGAIHDWWNSAEIAAMTAPTPLNKTPGYVP